MRNFVILIPFFRRLGARHPARHSHAITKLLLGALVAMALGASAGHAQSNNRSSTLSFSKSSSATSSGLIGEAFFKIRDDIRGIANIPFQDRRRTLHTLGAIGLLVLIDKPLTAFYQDRVETAFSGFSLPTIPGSDPLRRLGLSNEDVWMVLGIAGSYAFGALSRDEKMQRAALQSTKAIAYTFFTTQIVLKTLIGRKRPVAGLSTRATGDGTFTDNPYDFFNWRAPRFRSDAFGTAMPSFHFAQYFAVARVYSGIYDYSWIPYAAAGLLSVSNIRGHRHWVSDMVAGSLLGIAIGNVVLRNSEKYNSRRFTTIPSVSRGRVGLDFNIKY